ncbi:cyclin-D3-1-like isoform X2 [Magnolia sinica]|uniref:cyclin-D3-1-like isoform X2 n=1 Tax=Magnolia sinica TaxID=86752 RepID=UPI0026593D13|nr:cyclin-D3-1-like isoform X2 [Magnolia sinica]
MAPSYDCVGSSLLCPEDNNSILGFDDDGEVDVDGGEDGHGYHQKQWFLGDFLTGFPLQTDECLGLMVERECQHLPREDYLERLKSGVVGLSPRRDAVDWIRKVHAHYSFGPLSAYLSINYLDRFLSAYELPGKAWMMQLLAIACLSLAAKMEETEVPLSLDLQVGESKFVFEARTIQRMELLVLSTLKWRMQAVTPFSFIDYFLQKINDDKPPPRSSICKSVQLILGTIRGGIEFLEFRPSEVAAAVAITVSGETQTVDFNKAVSCCIHVEKDRVLRCYELIQEMGIVSRPVKGVNGPSTSVPQSPIGVLDAACLSYKSDETTVVSRANSVPTSASKRRRLNRLAEMDMKS